MNPKKGGGGGGDNLSIQLTLSHSIVTLKLG